MIIQQRNQGLDCLKALLAWLVILGHIIQIRIADGDANIVTTQMNYFIYSYHMPLFIAMSGYFLYGKKIEVKKFASRRTIQLLIPMIFWILLIIGFDFLNSVPVSIIKHNIITDLWYLKSLYIILIVSIPFMVVNNIMIKLFFLILVLTFSLVAGSIFLLALQVPAFYFGYYIHALEIRYINSNAFKNMLLFVAFMLFLLELFVIIPDININNLNVIRFGSISDFTNYINRLILAFSGTFVLFSIFKCLKCVEGVSELGKYSLGIYCIQSLITERFFSSLYIKFPIFLCMIVSLLQFIICALLCYSIAKNKYLRRTIGL